MALDLYPVTLVKLFIKWSITFILHVHVQRVEWSGVILILSNGKLRLKVLAKCVVFQLIYNYQILFQARQSWY